LSLNVIAAVHSSSIDMPAFPTLFSVTGESATSSFTVKWTIRSSCSLPSDREQLERAAHGKSFVDPPTRPPTVARFLDLRDPGF
jgi:hypothetical protein